MADYFETNDPIKSKENQDGLQSFYAVMFSTFSTVFIAEIGDKTQIATLLLSAQSGKPFVVFCGAALALICSSLVGVVIGQWLANILPPDRLENMAGILMIGLGIWLGLQASNSIFLEIKPV